MLSVQDLVRWSECLTFQNWSQYLMSEIGKCQTFCFSSFAARVSMAAQFTRNKAIHRPHSLKRRVTRKLGPEPMTAPLPAFQPSTEPLSHASQCCNWSCSNGIIQSYTRALLSHRGQFKQLRMWVHMTTRNCIHGLVHLVSRF